MLHIVIIGQVYQSFSLQELKYDKLAVVGVEKTGEIALFEAVNVENLEAREERIEKAMLVLKDRGLTAETEFLIPGFVDTHIHAPQFVFTGNGYDLGLLQWLQKYTFPKEAEFSSIDHAKKCYSRVVKKTLSCGTTTACYYATIHKSSAIILAEVCARFGQRAYIGKVNMDRNSPDFYVESTKDSLKDTEDFIDHVLKVIKSPLITPCITPRFVPSCTSLLMTELGALAERYHLPIQSHLCESLGEIEWVKELHPNIESYAKIYEQHGLLNDKTIMAHCIYMTREERELMVAKQTGVSHCPSSNFCLHSGVLNVRNLLNEGFSKIGLGTDVSGGYSPSIMDAMRQAIIASNVVGMNAGKEKPLNYAEVFYLATLGGAKVMNLEDKIGNFLVKKRFDAIIVDMDSKMSKTMLMEPDSAPAAVVDCFDEDPWSLFEKFIYLGDDRNMSKVFVDGKQVA